MGGHTSRGDFNSVVLSFFAKGVDMATWSNIASGFPILVESVFSVLVEIGLPVFLFGDLVLDFESSNNVFDFFCCNRRDRKFSVP